MNKIKTVFVCSDCGEDFPKWQGKCDNCGAWGTLKEFKKQKKSSGNSFMLSSGLPAVKLSSCKSSDIRRIESGFSEVDNVLGGGIVPGSLILLAGNPGIGKSTLVLHIAGFLNERGVNVLYVSGEESLEQLAMRAGRVGVKNSSIDVLAETSVERIVSSAVELKPSVMIIDSIQTLYSENIESAPGVVSQVRESTSMILRKAKESNIAVFIVGHVTKDGSIAGPRVLEHMVDAVLYFEGDSNYNYRILRSFKNRFGPAGEVAVFEMHDTGLSQVKDCSGFFVRSEESEHAGTAVVPLIEGSRVLLIEIQSLVNSTHFGMPQRVASGINPKKLALLTAVLEKYTDISFGEYDIFLNVTGGFTITEPASDLAITASLISSYKNRIVKKGMAFVGEVGLGGNIRSVNNMNKRLKELSALGFRVAVVPPLPRKSDWSKGVEGLQLLHCKNLSEVAELI